MTYYEWVTYIDEFRNKPITDDFIKKVNTYDFKLPLDAMIRLEDHILKVMFDKLSDIRDDLDNDLNKIKSPKELSILVDKIKDTIKDVSKLEKIKYYDAAFINEFKSDVEKYAGDYVETIKRHYKGITSNEYAVVINNMHLLEGV